MHTYKSIFAPHMTRYTELRRRLGAVFKGQESVLQAFDRYIHEQNYHGLLTEELALDFAYSRPTQTSSSVVPARRYLVIRHFSEYLATYESDTPRLNPKAIARSYQQPPAYIFTEQELQYLLKRCTSFISRHPLSTSSLRAMIGLAASTGLRAGEVIGLDCDDVDLQSSVLTIRDSKLGKDRLIPIHPSTRDVLHDYAEQRNHLTGSSTGSAFFLNSRLCRYQVFNLCYLFRRLVNEMDLHPPRNRRPTFHSLRHTFAVHRLAAWHRAGADTQSLLPVLATYMGHVHYTSTAYYLTATAEMLGIAAEKLGISTKQENEYD